MNWFRAIWPFAWPKPRTARRPFGIYVPRRRTWRDRLGRLADRVVREFNEPWTPGRTHTFWGWMVGLCFAAYAAIAATALYLFAPPLPSPSDLPPAPGVSARWFVPVSSMPTDDTNPEPPLTVRRTTWCPRPPITEDR